MKSTRTSIENTQRPRSRASNPELILPRVQLAYYHTGVCRIDEARVVIDEVLAINPDLNVERFAELASRWQPVSPEELATRNANLRKAGLE